MRRAWTEERMDRFKAWCVVCVVVLVCAWAGPAWAQGLAQDPEAWEEYNRQRVGVNQAGMITLMSWAGLNMAAGGVGWALSEDARWKGFHEMNAAWNVVNMAIGVFGYVGAAGEDPGALGLSETLLAGASIQKILMVNVGLDVGYAALGGLLWERGLRKGDERMIGWGQSLLLQGGFLFAFDVGLVVVHQGIFEELVWGLSPSPGGASAQIMGRF
jgi:hypothetical protein